jgi:aspartyl-tRNA(Asn)/glutamyl-tRNA(Gln) amidotransferase subunit A
MALLDNLERKMSIIEEKNPKLNALLFVEDGVSLRQKAMLIQEKIDENRAGRLAGKIIIIKANISKIGYPVSCGSKTLENYKGTFDSDVVRKIEAEDGLIIGVANCDEFACGSSGTHSAFGPTLNPYDDARITGGSSSGSAAAVASGMADIALGSDTGGSIRNPASHCGVIGLKPSYGRVSRHGLIDLSMSLDQIGPLAKTMDEIEAVFDTIKGVSQKDSVTYEKEKEEIGELRVAYLDLSGVVVQKNIMELFNETIRRLNVTEQITISNIPLGIASYYPLVYTEFFSATRRFDGRRYGNKIEESCGDEVLRRIIGGSIVSSAEDENRFYRKALSVKKSITTGFEEAFMKYDIIISPVVPRIARRIDEQTTIEEEYYEDALTIPANLAGICAASFPIGMIEGMPVGLHVMAGSMKEKTLFRFLRELERNAK